MAITHNQFVQMLQDAADLMKEGLFNFGQETATHNVISLTQQIEANAKGVYGADLRTKARRFRTRYAALWSATKMRELLDPIFRLALIDLIGANRNEVADVKAAWWRIVEYFQGGSYSVKTRGITFDSSPTAAGTGDGVIYRLTKDRFGETAENGYYPLDVTLRCIADESGGASPGEEAFSISAPSQLDVLEQGLGGTPNLPTILRALNSDGPYLKNASFQSGKAANSNPSSLGGWLDTTGTYGSARYAIDATDTFMSSTEEAESGVPLSLEIKGDHEIYQEMEGLNTALPIFWTARIRPGASISGGSLTVGWGNQTKATTLTSITAGSFNLVTPTLDENLYPYNFATGSNAKKFRIAVSGLAGDTVKIDNIRLGNMVPFNGLWYFADPGTTQFRSGASKKTFLFEDVLAGSDAIIQRILALAYGLSLPASGTPTISDP